MDAIIRVLLRTVVETVLRRLQQALRRPPKADTPLAPSGGWIETADSETERRPVTKRPIPAQTVPLTTMQAHHDPQDKKLSARALRQRLKDPQSLRQAILINEILNKPLALRRHRLR